MRIVAAGSAGYIDQAKEYIREIGEGIIFFSEFQLNDTGLWNNSLAELAPLTKDKPVTLIGGLSKRIRIIKNGEISSAQLYDWYLDNDVDFYNSLDKIHNVSYDPSRDISALCREYPHQDIPYLGKRKADLLLLTSTEDFSDKLDSLVKLHKSSLKPNSFIVQSGGHKLPNFIYSVKDNEMVGVKLASSYDDNCLIHDF